MLNVGNISCQTCSCQTLSCCCPAEANISQRIDCGCTVSPPMLEPSLWQYYDCCCPDNGNITIDKALPMAILPVAFYNVITHMYSSRMIKDMPRRLMALILTSHQLLSRLRVYLASTQRNPDSGNTTTFTLSQRVAI
jgi:hypothetical protein